MRLIHILYTEDNHLVLHAVRETLELEGWSVAACTDGLAALGRLESGERFDALLCDHDLPGLSGVELIRRARRLSQHRRTPIVMLSASEARAEALSAGADVFLRKPQDVGRLVETLAELLFSTSVET